VNPAIRRSKRELLESRVDEALHPSSNFLQLTIFHSLCFTAVYVFKSSAIRNIHTRSLVPRPQPLWQIPSSRATRQREIAPGAPKSEAPSATDPLSLKTYGTHHDPSDILLLHSLPCKNCSITHQRRPRIRGSWGRTGELYMSAS
jgi:hypothetical protein